VDPDAAQSQSLRRADVELQVIADHPRRIRAHAEAAKRLEIHRLLGLAVPHLTLDEDRVEPAREIVSLDLVALLPGVALGHEGQRNAALAETREKRGRLRKQPPCLPPTLCVDARDLSRRPRIRATARLECACGDLRPRAQHVDALAAVALGVAPEPLARVEQGREQGVALEPRSGPLARGLPARIDTAGVVEQRVVEIDEQRLHAELSAAIARRRRGSRTRRASVTTASAPA